VEGTITGKVTLAAATPSNTGTTPTIYLVNNITYATNDGTVGFTAIAEGNVLIPLNSPDSMTLSGVFVAHNGRYGRNLYVSDNAYDPYDVPEAYNSYVFRTQLTTIGTVVSSLRTGTSWASGGVPSSGYLSRIDAYDQTQATNPPPFTPSHRPITVSCVESNNLLALKGRETGVSVSESRRALRTGVQGGALRRSAIRALA
jgi:hypothetical protein